MQKFTITKTITAGLIALILASCGNNNKTEAKPSTPPATFPVSTLKKTTITGYNEYPTNIEGIINSDVRAKTSGYIQQVLVDEGQKVTKGQVLFKLETETLNQSADAAKASVNVAKVEVEKLIPLVEKNIISPIQLQTAKANLAQAEANYNSIIANINYATVKSPVNGFVGAINFREGTLVSPSDATPLTTVSDIKQVYAFFSLNESDYLSFLEKTPGKNINEKIKNFPAVNLILANGSVYNEKGKIETSTKQINKNTGTVSFRAIFNNPNQLLTNGNSGKIQIPTEYKDAIVIPQEATFEQQKDILTFKVSESNKTQEAIIKIKASIDNLYVVEEGLKEGDILVVDGVGKLRNDTPITPQKVAFDSIVKPIQTFFRN